MNISGWWLDWEIANNYENASIYIHFCGFSIFDQFQKRVKQTLRLFFFTTEGPEKNRCESSHWILGEIGDCLFVRALGWFLEFPRKHIAEEPQKKLGRQGFRATRTQGFEATILIQFPDVSKGSLPAIVWAQMDDKPIELGGEWWHNFWEKL